MSLLRKETRHSGSLPGGGVFRSSALADPRRARGGFTLVEMLSALGILVIMFALITPAIFAIRRDLRQTELDSKAETVYAAAQNRLTKLRSGGRSASYQLQDATHPGTGVRVLPGDPSDRAGEIDETGQPVDMAQLCYFTYLESGAERSAAAIVMSRGAVDESLRGERWVVEYDPKGCSVYAVWYAEGEMLEDYSDNWSLYDRLRNRGQRLTDGARVGYYGGDSVSADTGIVLRPTISVMNKEKLSVTCQCTSPGTVSSSNALIFDVTLSDNEGHSVTTTYEYAGLNRLERLRHNYYVTIPLDDLSSEATRFAKLYGRDSGRPSSQRLVGGAELTISLTVRSKNMAILPKTVTARTNSLFADESNTHRDRRGLVDTAVVAYGRHLQNLAELAEGGVFAGDTEIDKVVLANDISFRSGTGSDGWHATYCGTGKTYFNGSDESGKAKFKPLPQGTIASFDGKGHAISGLNAQGGNDAAGLFASTSGSLEVRDLRLVGATAKSSSAPAGTLVGEVSGGSVTLRGVQSYLSVAEHDTDGRGKDDALVSGSSAGGLVGRVAASARVGATECLAATVLSSTGSAGGLAGDVAGTVTLGESYADCYVTGKAAGGLAGRVAEGGKLSAESCYAAGFLYPSETGAGIAGGRVETLRNTYTICAFDEHTHNNYSTAASVGTAERAWYMRPGSTDAHDAAGTSAIGGTSESDLAGSVGSAFTTSNAAAHTHPYALLGQSHTQYTWPRLSKLEHYGDWEADFHTGSLVYYERYSSSAGEFYGFLGGDAASSLTDAGVVIGDGYGIAYRKDDPLPGRISVTVAGMTHVIEDMSSAPRHAVHGPDGTDYVVFPLPAAMVNQAPSGSGFWERATVESTSGGAGSPARVDRYLVNTHFAVAPLRMDDGLPDELPGLADDARIAVRTPRHLHALSLHYDAYAEATDGRTFVQERDIDYRQYDWATHYDASVESVTEQAPIGEGDRGHASFSATYDGQCRVVSGASFVSEDGAFIGFVGRNEGTLRNVVLWSDYDEHRDDNDSIRRLQSLGSNDYVHMGVLAGQNAEGALVENCAVAGYYLAGEDGTLYAYASSHLYAGGLVGTNDGIIRNCSSDCPTLRISALNADVRAGGLVGVNGAGGAGATVSDCYALGHVEVAWARGGSVHTAGFCGANSGSIADSYCCVSLTSSGETAFTHAFAPAGGYAARCRYLDDGTFLYAGNLHSYNASSGDTAGTPVMRPELVSSAGSAKPDEAHTRTYFADNQGKAYPFASSVSDMSGAPVHYGDWQSDAVLGRLGLFYWEHETGGANDGYHISYAGFADGEAVHGSTLCEAHDDGGVITEYGYGYFVERGQESKVSQSLSGIENSGDSFDAGVGEVLGQQMPEYSFFPYRTRLDGSNFVRLSAGNDVRDGIWTLSFAGDGDVQSYAFTVSPFFANAMGYAGGGSSSDSAGAVTDWSATPGSASNAYEVRSVDQLRYINWNGTNLDTDTFVDRQTYLQFPYLQHATSLSKGTQTKDAIEAIRPAQTWRQTHDVTGYAGMEPYTPIAPIATASGYQSYDSVLCAWFGGDYDGQSYKVGNFDIVSDTYSVGLFGQTVGANMRNIILYSNQGNRIERVTDQGGHVGETPGAYAIGGIIGIAYDYNLKQSTNYVRNCAVAGYSVIDSSTNAHTLGGANIGALVGVSGVNLERCSAVANVLVQCTHDNGSSAYGNYIHVGMLAGAVRTNVTDCYAGGTISISDVTNNEMYLDHNGTPDTVPTGEKNRDYAVHIYAGGIASNAFTVNYINFTNSTGAWNLSTPVYTNCYSYTRLPSIKGNTRAVSLIAGIADRYGQGQPVTFNNCHYLASLVDAITYEKTPYHFKVNKNDTGLSEQEFQDVLNGNLQAMKRLVHNDNKTNPIPIGVPNRVSYDDLRGLAGTLGPNWSTVTVTEGTAGGSQRYIPGKYSFPGSRTDLLGKNYPFPTTVTQPDLSFNRTVDVHYGEWPNDGVYWEEGLATIDVFRDMDPSTGTAARTFVLHDENGMMGVPDISFDTQGIARVAGGVRQVPGGYEVTIQALSEGAVTVTATEGVNGASFVLDVSAKLAVSMSPTEIEGYQGKRSQATLSARSALDSSKDYSTQGSWSVSESSLSDVTVTGNTLLVGHEDPGSEVLEATFRYGYMGKTSSAMTYVPVRTIGSVGMSASPAMTGGARMFAQAARTDSGGIIAGTSATPVPVPTMPAGASGEVFLYETASDASLSAGGLSRASVAAIRFDFVAGGQEESCSYDASGNPLGTEPEGISFVTGFAGAVARSGAYDVRAGSARYVGSVPISDVTMTVLLSHPADGGTTYSLGMPVRIPGFVASFDGNGGTGEVAPILGFGEAIELPDCGFERAGFLFAGWEPDDGGDALMPGDEVELTHDTTFLAVWQPVTYSIEFDANGGDGEMDPLEGLSYGTAYTLPQSEFTHETKAFVGWSSRQQGPVEWDDEATVEDLSTEDGATVTLFAQWEDTRTLTLDAGVGADPEVQEFPVVSGRTRSLDGYVTPVLGTYGLAGWATDESGETILLDASGNLRGDVPGYSSGGAFDLAIDRTLYAVWKTPIEFVANGASAFYFQNTLASEYVAPTKAGCVLQGWYDANDQDAEQPLVAADGTVLGDLDWESGMTLVAKWFGKKTEVLSDFTPTGTGDARKFVHSVDIDFAAGDQLEVRMDLSTGVSTNARENIFGIGTDISKWDGGDSSLVYTWKDPNNLTTSKIRWQFRTAQETLNATDTSVPNTQEFTILYTGDKVYANGAEFSTKYSAAWERLVERHGDAAWQVGSAEGSNRSYASHYYVTVLGYTFG